MNNILEKVKNEHTLTKPEIITLLTMPENDKLFKLADDIRKQYVGNAVHLRALIEFSNICRCNCFYCGIRADNKSTNRYRLSKEEILTYANNAVKLGYKTIVLQSGEDLHFSAELLAEIITKIKKYDVAVTLSIGERTYNEYKILKEAGANRFLLRIETTNKNLYEKMHPKMSLENRIDCLNNLKKLGFETGTGCLVGLPEQTVESLADDILFFKEINADMVGIGPLITHSETPLKGLPNGDFDTALRVMAITRLLLPDINIPATTAMETICPNGRIIALQSGANVVMPNVLDDFYKKKYDIYPDKKGINANVDSQFAEFKNILAKIGRYIATDYGNRL